MLLLSKKPNQNKTNRSTVKLSLGIINIILFKPNKFSVALEPSTIIFLMKGLMMPPLHMTKTALRMGKMSTYFLKDPADIIRSKTAQYCSVAHCA